jgi:hypothetical protein
MYVAIVLNEKSQRVLKNRLIALSVQRVVPVIDWRLWNLKCHHCTLALGVETGYKFEERVLTVDAIASNDLVIAFKVKGAEDSKNATPHVTAAVNHRGRSVMSNELTNWLEIEPLEITGEVKICYPLI